MIIAVDFDGTCVEHRYPDIGQDVPHAVESLKKLIKMGHDLILYTMRDGEELKQAEKWFENRDIKLYASQKNPQQSSWTSSNKCYANKYIDDAAVGCPLIIPFRGRPYVDWERVMKLLSFKVNEETLTTYGVVK